MIEGIDDEVLLMSSLMKPKKITLVGSDGKPYGFLCKREDSGDMRKDARLMEFAAVVNRSLARDPQAGKRQLLLRTYAVLPLTEDCGIIEWMTNLNSLRGIVSDIHRRNRVNTTTAQIKEAFEKKKSSNLEFYEQWLLPRFPPVLHEFFLAKFVDPTAWLDARLIFTRSVAVWSITGYVVGLGDRHGENIMIDQTSGACAHVDFACLFEKGLTLKVPEVVPFRLTPNLTDAMGVTGYEGAFRTAAEITMRILRNSREALMSVLETFLHDPLVEWGRQVVPGAASTDSATAMAGTTHNAYAIRTRRAVELKLVGVLAGAVPLSVEGQVHRLILDATSHLNLSNMYIWWMAWL
uniref:Serine/threonine-protein kinase ATR n=1 Tax=Compsopogon caeruleus TaxID=31354 RepID=A0A7S1T8L2_9RHOD